MSDFMFGSDKGHLSDDADLVAEKYGAGLCNYTDPGCGCGRGHTKHCPANRRHWFTGPNRGEPFNGQMRDAVLNDPRIMEYKLIALQSYRKELDR